MSSPGNPAHPGHRPAPLPGSTERVRANSALVLAPHYDDEVLGAGGLVTQLTASGAVVRVLFLSDSGGAEGDTEARKAMSQRRRQEAKAASQVLAVAGIEHLEVPDGSLEHHLDQVADGIRKALMSQRPGLLLVPSPLEVSADHRATFAALHRVLGGLRRGDALWPLVRDLEILAYEINHPQNPDLLVDISGEVETLRQAMACYTSQQEQHDYLEASLGLARFRTLSLGPDVEAAEGYRRLSLDDFTTHGLSNLVARLGGQPSLLSVTEGPRISVIVRTKDRPELLAEALDSLAASTYGRADVIVVNDGGATPQLPADFPLPAQIVNLETNRGRAAAANAGIAAAQGDYITFLDDDDLVEPEHLATLAGLVGAAGVRVAYTDAAVGVYELSEDGWSCVERRLPYSRDFDPELLLFDNYIPFHTLLIERSLCQQTGPIDETLPFFEDWDFLIRLAKHAPFHHLARVTCEYRHFRGGGHHILGDQPRGRDDFLEMKARVLSKHALDENAAPDVTAQRVAQAIDRLRADQVIENEDVSRLRRELAGRRDEILKLADEVSQGEERYHQLNGELQGVRVNQQAIETSERRALADLREREADVLRQTQLIEELRRQQEQLKHDIDSQSKTLRQTYDEIERLNQLIRDMEASKAWRVHQWIQRRKA
ncbi:MAG: PIG-L family deacetylase [Acidobacteriota bacterium]